MGHAKYCTMPVLPLLPQAVVSQVMSVQQVSCCDQGGSSSTTLVDLGAAGQLRLHRHLSLAGEGVSEGHTLGGGRAG